ncbi:hypothetical protein L484_017603 [Morus notabilis]|uniref:Uncharacterized protein n=1 Tax=Morus notabilis TaxID=981085 RepID=W9R833_9ROSA|nr:hypothetical protein L484_017603 [Morus notabilis]
MELVNTPGGVGATVALASFVVFQNPKTRNAPETKIFRRRTRKKKMIYRKWSLLTLPAVLGGVGATVALASFVVFQNNPFSTLKEKIPDSVRSEAATK